VFLAGLARHTYRSCPRAAGVSDWRTTPSVSFEELVGSGETNSPTGGTRDFLEGGNHGRIGRNAYTD
jgi:hypothetical protein